MSKNENRLSLFDYKIPKDTLWKLIIEGETEPCLWFFFPKMAAQIDFSKGVRFLGEEFFKLFPELQNNSQNRRLDKLIEVTMKTGETQWLLIHIEVQGYVDAEFTRRMFEYFYRILEKYQKPVTALAIFTDDDPNFHPTEHRISCWGTEMVYHFNTYKLLEKTPADFQDKDNLFSIIMETAWYGLRKNKPDDTALYDIKLQLIRRFLEMGYPKNHIRLILTFLGFYTNFEDTTITKNFTKEMNEIAYKYTGTKDIGQVILEQLDDETRANMEKEVTEKVTKKVTEEVTEKVTEEVTEKVTEEVTEQVMKDSVLKSKQYGLTDIQIAEMYQIPLEEVQRFLEETKDNK